MAFKSGKNGKVRINSATLAVTNWRVEPRVDKLDTTNSESAGVGEYIGGVFDIDVTLTFDYNYGGAPFGTLLPGTTVSTVVLYIDGTGGASWSMTSMFIERATMESPTRGKVSVTLQGNGMGAIVAPTS